MPFTNPAAQFGIHNTDGTAILKGCAFMLSGGLTAGGLVKVKHCTGADVRPAGVVQENDLPGNGDGVGYQIGLSNVQVRLASGISAEDRLRVANTAGEFETAPLLSTNVCFVAVSNGSSGTDTTWAMPVGTRPL